MTCAVTRSRLRKGVGRLIHMLIIFGDAPASRQPVEMSTGSQFCIDCSIPLLRVSPSSRVYTVTRVPARAFPFLFSLSSSVASNAAGL